MQDDELTLGIPSPRTLQVQPVTKASFEPYGWIVEAGESDHVVNNGTALRHDIHAHAASDVLPGTRLVTSIFEAKAQHPDQPIEMLERHPNSIQLIVPLGGAGHIVVVSQNKADGTPDFSTFAAFWLSAAQGLIYRRGLWHHPIMAIGADARFLVQSWQNGTEADCETIAIEARAVSQGGSD